MAQPVAIWKGSDLEALRLAEAVGRHCRANERDANGNPLVCGELCGAHSLMRTQRSLDRLLWGRRTFEMRRAEEFDPKLARAFRQRPSQ